MSKTRTRAGKKFLKEQSQNPIQLERLLKKDLVSRLYLMTRTKAILVEILSRKGLSLPCMDTDIQLCHKCKFTKCPVNPGFNK